MKQRPQYTINALILEAATRNDFGVTKASLSRELVLTYQKVNDYCEELVQKGLLDYDPTTRTYLATPAGSQMLRLTKELGYHYSPVKSIFTKYKTRIDTGAKGRRERTRKILEQTYQEGQLRLKLVVASPLLLAEHLFIYLDECIVQALPC